MHTLIISLSILLLTILTFVAVRPVSKLEQSLIRQRRQKPTDLIPHQQNSTTNNYEMVDGIWNSIKNVLNDHMNSHLNGSSKSECKQTTYTNGDYVEYCLEKILNQDGKSYSTRTSEILYTSNGTIIPLHQAESAIEIETYNHKN